MNFTVAIIGRPNVGKSTLFNRLTGKKHAIVDDKPGVTRDRREGRARISDMYFRLIDTPGLEESEEGSLENRMMKQTAIAVEEADICLMLVDGRAGIMPDDKFFAKWLRKKGKPVILVINKCESKESSYVYSDAARLGFDYTVAISAEHNEGMADLYDAISVFHVPDEDATSEYEEGEMSGSDDEQAIQIAIIGRPNAGKSTLLNSLIGKDRVLTGPEAGLTRDSIAIDWQFEGKPIKLVDTAGIRRKQDQKLESLAVHDSHRAVRYANVVILLMDVTQAFEKQDLSLADMVVKEGRGLVIAVNKWDLVKENRGEMLKEIKAKTEEALPQIRGVPVVTLSASNMENVKTVIRAALAVYDVWNRRVPTAALNQWLKHAQEKHTPPLGSDKRRIKAKFATQIKRRPPTFNIFLNKPEDLPDSYKRYLIGSLRDEFNLMGVPIRINTKKSENPYAK